MTVIDTMVRNQNHYAKHYIQPIDYMRAIMSPEEFEGYLRGNVLKYVSRYPDKNGLQDLEKAHVYLEWLYDFKREQIMKKAMSTGVQRETP